MSGVERRTAMMCHNKGGVQDSGWRRCVTKIGSMLEPTPFSSRVDSSTDSHDMEYDDMISHIDDLAWVRYQDRNVLSGTSSAVKGSFNGWVHGGISIYYNQV